MRQVMIRNLSRPQHAPLVARYCAGFLCRLRGLIGRSELKPEQGLLLVCPRQSRLDAAVHMLGVRIRLAVVWLNSALEVVDVRLALPWRWMYVPRQAARYVLELNAQRLSDFSIGDQVGMDVYEGD